PRDRDTAESGDRSGQAPRSRTAGRGRRGQDPPAEAPLTKRDLLRYAAQIAPIVLPYLSRRALNLHRFPDGVGGKGFWQRDLPDHAPDWLHRWEHKDSGSKDATTQL